MKESRLLQILSEHNLTITTAESCTGGLLAGLLCDISGISSYFEEGYITYSENAKEKILGVSKDVIEKYGVVSMETAIAMAEGAAKKASASCAVSTTGIAGPTGGTDKTPVGCVCVAWKIYDAVYSEQLQIEGSRMEIRMQAASYALERLCDYIEQTIKEN